MPKQKADDDKDIDKKKKHSVFFGYACKKAYYLRDCLESGNITVDQILGVVDGEVQRDKCPNPDHQDVAVCFCQPIEHLWMDQHGALSLKLFLKHLSPTNENRFRELCRRSTERLETLKAIAERGANSRLRRRIENLIRRRDCSAANFDRMCGVDNEQT